MCLRPAPLSDSATRLGSSLSTAAGFPVLTLQKPQARVQVSPRIMMVATPLAQHSPMFGQAASWQTVWRLWASMFDLVAWKFLPPGSLALSQLGFFLMLRWWIASFWLLRIMEPREKAGLRVAMGSPPRGLGWRLRVRDWLDSGIFGESL